MKKSVGIFMTFMIASFGIAWSLDSMDKTQKPKVEQKILLVPGNKDLTATGITLNEKDRVTIKATGNIYFSSGKAQSKAGPEGWGRGSYAIDWPEDANACDDPLMDENHAALIAEVDGEFFIIGKEADFSGKVGLLYLGINDCTFTGDLFNTGQFSVIIRIEKGINSS